jgi:hypothetical protein
VVEQFEKIHLSKILKPNLVLNVLRFIFKFFVVLPRCLFKVFYEFIVVLFKNFLIWVHFHPFYFLFVSEGAFMSDDLGEYTSKDSNDWEKLGFFFGPGGI